MKLLSLPLLPIWASLANAALLVDYNATRGDAVSKIGTILNLEKERHNSIKENIPDLYIKTDKDWEGKPSAHCHRKKGYIRTEYHALKDQIQTDKTYYIGYRFAVNQLQQSLTVFQWKEYTNTEQPGGANVPMALAFNAAGNIVLYTNQPGTAKSIELWEKAVGRRSAIDLALEIKPRKSGGSVRLWFNGKPATFVLPGGDHAQVFTGNLMPGSTSPKWGAYRGEEAEIDTWIYQVQVGESKADLDKRFFS